MLRQTAGSGRFLVLSRNEGEPVQRGHLLDQSGIHMWTVLFVLLHLCKYNVLCKVIKEKIKILHYFYYCDRVNAIGNEVLPWVIIPKPQIMLMTSAN